MTTPHPCTETNCECTWLGDHLQPALDEFDAAAQGAASERIPTGFTQLDELTTGLLPGTLTVIGGYPGTGSSVLALDFTRYAVLKRNIPAAFLTFDTRPQEIVQRLLSSEAKIKLWDLRTGRMTDDDWTKLARRMSEIDEAPIVIDRPRDRDITAIVEQITTLVDNHGTKLVILDPLHMLTARTDLPYENREREVAEITRRLKVLALDTDTAIVVTSHLTNNPGPRQAIPGPPTLADLRDSGTIAHIADVVILLHRPDLWERDDPRGGEVDLMVVKHRQGPTATITVAHQLHLSRLVDLARG